MISEFKIKNETTEKEVTFGMEDGFDYLISSIDWGNVSANHNTYNYPNQVGVSISSTKLNTRDITIEGHVYYIMNPEDRSEMSYNEIINYCYDRIKEKKMLLDELVNPSDFLKISIGHYYIEGKPSNSIIFGKTEDENNIYFCKFMINIFCANPMFKKDTISETNIQGSIGMFHFPLIIPPEGIALSSREDYLILGVENEGSVPIGGRIIFTALGNVLNPSIENLATGENIKLNKMLSPGEKVIITTIDGRDRGIIGIKDGFEHDYLGYWDYDNTWFKFAVGTTLLGYFTDNSTENLLDVVIEINPEKFSLEEM